MTTDIQSALRPPLALPHLAGISVIQLIFMEFLQQSGTAFKITISPMQKTRAPGPDSTSPLLLSQRSNENARHRTCIVTDLKQFDPSKAA
ncbi:MULTISPECIES: hypothetical protein [unclassified Ensifer]|uniref:hypothetical protein n=1 Tax=unclassified Ensifer TaxID=2633371 RepID=UPI00137A4B83|nr:MULTISPECIES: hypothetical protein [unclassified Ensifer]